jgi:hypothetical protein
LQFTMFDKARVEKVRVAKYKILSITFPNGLFK